jgi:DNA-binding MarR family transcriptional regulator
MFESIIILAGILLALTIATALEYYRILRRAQKEYERAKDMVEEIVLSFDRQLKRENERLEFVAYKIEGMASKIDGAMNKTNQTEKKMSALEDKATAISEERERLLARLDITDSNLRDVVASQEAVTSKITSLEEQAKRFPVVSEANVEAVIPIRRDKALAPLTETELSALEFLASEGPKTAPEIKWRIRLSREHTARLMKKLYESGYLERDTNKIPFRYSVKKEMEKLLKNAEPETSESLE